MQIFSRYPALRLLFVFTYIAFAVYILIDNFAWLNGIFSLLMLFGSYISLVKSKIIRDKNANKISDFMFDLLSILITIFLIINIIFL